jgi:hypothetical protein
MMALGAGPLWPEATASQWPPAAANSQDSVAEQQRRSLRVPPISARSSGNANVSVASEELIEVTEPLSLMQFFTGADMYHAILRSIKNLQHSFCGFQYNIDHTDICIQLVVKLTEGAEGRFLLDKNNFYSSSCARQPARVKELFEAGCKLKMLKPYGGGFAVMHVKCLVLDETLLFDGSVNLTHNGLENNKEHLYQISEPTVVQAVLYDFEETWKVAETIGEHDIEHMWAKHLEREEKKKEEQEERAAKLGEARRVRSASKEVERRNKNKVVIDEPPIEPSLAGRSADGKPSL